MPLKTLDGPDEHFVEIDRHGAFGARAQCLCGWIYQGTLSDCEIVAQIHINSYITDPKMRIYGQTE